MSILSIKNLIIHSHGIPIVDNINLSIEQGEWMALIGESGSGKSVTASSVGLLIPKDLELVSGEINFNGKDMRMLGEEELRKIRGKEVAYVFQDYQNAFTPFIKIGKQIDEMIKCHIDIPKEERKNIIIKALNEVGLDEKRVFNSYPFQLSGGQLQRAAIAQAVILKPRLLIADEPTTALDAVNAVKVLKLLQEVKEKTKCAVLFITHDLRCAKSYATTMAIMHSGKIVEIGSKNNIVNNPKHSYTKNLFASIPPMQHVPDRLPITDKYYIV
ncbi:peptide/nickel transport system ATP-binding protein [Clostridium tetanomorphum]|uniref:ABC transporter ATP-binding protein n=1 Tax=Clostridium tetanomorphum TaxID=1553 RepID=A0A923E6E5_CLOTT|nr:ABC transporter ATP-binding protein [Clostridium tetanomorphum]KAJ53716.1 oligopeptide ABC transporter [Clostridium tetanomorphum DSM 665]MBC2397228.1 ABC transporter ATP-binding protein [Clostridium tetanomorphum]MBP1862444.1 peptide/nickel transport system ATP-binding protein [Clostridium tetanomorphum]NRS85716.1 peptide/nickel transport system ATP-binding protein [Clostridium tetanomorphum]NRZ96274.1 peptide/nickel transport system ATP-binding protein [Clostridium tetanomorphum]